jgi:hypothetical protein
VRLCSLSFGGTRSTPLQPMLTARCADADTTLESATLANVSTAQLYRAGGGCILRASCSRSQELMTPSGGKAWRDELRRIGHNMSADFHR